MGQSYDKLVSFFVMMQRYKNMIWDPNKKTLFGKNGVSWLSIILGTLVVSLCVGVFVHCTLEVKKSRQESEAQLTKIMLEKNILPLQFEIPNPSAASATLIRLNAKSEKIASKVPIFVNRSVIVLEETAVLAGKEDYIQLKTPNILNRRKRQVFTDRTPLKRKRRDLGVLKILNKNKSNTDLDRTVEKVNRTRTKRQYIPNFADLKKTDKTTITRKAPVVALKTTTKIIIRNTPSSTNLTSLNKTGILKTSVSTPKLGSNKTTRRQKLVQNTDRKVGNKGTDKLKSSKREFTDNQYKVIGSSVSNASSNFKMSNTLETNTKTILSHTLLTPLNKTVNEEGPPRNIMYSEDVVHKITYFPPETERPPITLPAESQTLFPDKVLRILSKPGKDQPALTNPVTTQKSRVTVGNDIFTVTQIEQSNVSDGISKKSIFSPTSNSSNTIKNDEFFKQHNKTSSSGQYLDFMNSTDVNRDMRQIQSFQEELNETQMELPDGTLSIKALNLQEPISKKIYSGAALPFSDKTTMEQLSTIREDSTQSNKGGKGITSQSDGAVIGEKEVQKITQIKLSNTSEKIVKKSILSPALNSSNMSGMNQNKTFFLKMTKQGKKTKRSIPNFLNHTVGSFEIKQKRYAGNFRSSVSFKLTEPSTFENTSKNNISGTVSTSTALTALDNKTTVSHILLTPLNKTVIEQSPPRNIMYSEDVVHKITYFPPETEMPPITLPAESQTLFPDEVLRILSKPGKDQPALTKPVTTQRSRVIVNKDFSTITQIEQSNVSDRISKKSIFSPTSNSSNTIKNDEFFKQHNKTSSSGQYLDFMNSTDVNRDMRQIQSFQEGLNKPQMQLPYGTLPIKPLILQEPISEKIYSGTALPFSDKTTMEQFSTIRRDSIQSNKGGKEITSQSDGAVIGEEEVQKITQIKQSNTSEKIVKRSILSLALNSSDMSGMNQNKTFFLKMTKHSKKTKRSIPNFLNHTVGSFEIKQKRYAGDFRSSVSFKLTEPSTFENTSKNNISGTVSTPTALTAVDNKTILSHILLTPLNKSVIEQSPPRNIMYSEDVVHKITYFPPETEMPPITLPAESQTLFPDEVLRILSKPGKYQPALTKPVTTQRSRVIVGKDFFTIAQINQSNVSDKISKKSILSPTSNSSNTINNDEFFKQDYKTSSSGQYSDFMNSTDVNRDMRQVQSFQEELNETQMELPDGTMFNKPSDLQEPNSKKIYSGTALLFLDKTNMEQFSTIRENSDQSSEGGKDVVFGIKNLSTELKQPTISEQTSKSIILVKVSSSLPITVEEEASPTKINTQSDGVLFGEKEVPKITQIKQSNTSEKIFKKSILSPALNSSNMSGVNKNNTFFLKTTKQGIKTRRSIPDFLKYAVDNIEIKQKRYTENFPSNVSLKLKEPSSFENTSKNNISGTVSTSTATTALDNKTIVSHTLLTSLNKTVNEQIPPRNIMYSEDVVHKITYFPPETEMPPITLPAESQTLFPDEVLRILSKPGKDQPTLTNPLTTQGSGVITGEDVFTTTQIKQLNLSDRMSKKSILSPASNSSNTIKNDEFFKHDNKTSSSEKISDFMNGTDVSREMREIQSFQKKNNETQIKLPNSTLFIKASDLQELISKNIYSGTAFFFFSTIKEDSTQSSKGGKDVVFGIKKLSTELKQPTILEKTPKNVLLKTVSSSLPLTLEDEASPAKIETQTDEALFGEVKVPKITQIKQSNTSEKIFKKSILSPTLNSSNISGMTQNNTFFLKTTKQGKKTRRSISDFLKDTAGNIEINQKRYADIPSNISLKLKEPITFENKSKNTVSGTVSTAITAQDNKNIVSDTLLISLNKTVNQQSPPRNIMYSEDVVHKITYFSPETKRPPITLPAESQTLFPDEVLRILSEPGKDQLALTKPVTTQRSRVIVGRDVFSITEIEQSNVSDRMSKKSILSPTSNSSNTIKNDQFFKQDNKTSSSGQYLYFMNSTDVNRDMRQIQSFQEEINETQMGLSDDTLTIKPLDLQEQISKKNYSGTALPFSDKTTMEQFSTIMENSTQSYKGGKGITSQSDGAVIGEEEVQNIPQIKQSNTSEKIVKKSILSLALNSSNTSGMNQNITFFLKTTKQGKKSRRSIPDFLKYTVDNIENQTEKQKRYSDNFLSNVSLKIKEPSSFENTGKNNISGTVLTSTAPTSDKITHDNKVILNKKVAQNITNLSRKLNESNYLEKPPINAFLGSVYNFSNKNDVDKPVLISGNSTLDNRVLFREKVVHGTQNLSPELENPISSNVASKTQKKSSLGLIPNSSYITENPGLLFNTEGQDNGTKHSGQNFADLKTITVIDKEKEYTKTQIKLDDQPVKISLEIKDPSSLEKTTTQTVLGTVPTSLNKTVFDKVAQTVHINGVYTTTNIYPVLKHPDYFETTSKNLLSDIVLGSGSKTIIDKSAPRLEKTTQKNRVIIDEEVFHWVTNLSLEIKEQKSLNQTSKNLSSGTVSIRVNTNVPNYKEIRRSGVLFNKTKEMKKSDVFDGMSKQSILSPASNFSITASAFSDMNNNDDVFVNSIGQDNNTRSNRQSFSNKTNRNVTDKAMERMNAFKQESMGNQDTFKDDFVITTSPKFKALDVTYPEENTKSYRIVRNEENPFAKKSNSSEKISKKSISSQASRPFNMIEDDEDIFNAVQQNNNTRQARKYFFGELGPNNSFEEKKESLEFNETTILELTTQPIFLNKAFNSSEKTSETYLLSRVLLNKTALTNRKSTQVLFDEEVNNTTQIEKPSISDREFKKSHSKFSINKIKKQANKTRTKRFADFTNSTLGNEEKKKSKLLYKEFTEEYKKVLGTFFPFLSLDQNTTNESKKNEKENNNVTYTIAPMKEENTENNNSFNVLLEIENLKVSGYGNNKKENNTRSKRVSSDLISRTAKNKKNSKQKTLKNANIENNNELVGVPCSTTPSALDEPYTTKKINNKTILQEVLNPEKTEKNDSEKKNNSAILSIVFTSFVKTEYGNNLPGNLTHFTTKNTHELFSNCTTDRPYKRDYTIASTEEYTANKDELFVPKKVSNDSNFSVSNYSNITLVDIVAPKTPKSIMYDNEKSISQNFSIPKDNRTSLLKNNTSGINTILKNVTKQPLINNKYKNKNNNSNIKQRNKRDIFFDKFAGEKLEQIEKKSSMHTTITESLSKNAEGKQIESKNQIQVMSEENITNIFEVKRNNANNTEKPLRFKRNIPSVLPITSVLGKQNKEKDTKKIISYKMKRLNQETILNKIVKAKLEKMVLKEVMNKVMGKRFTKNVVPKVKNQSNILDKMTKAKLLNEVLDKAEGTKDAKTLLYGNYKADNLKIKKYQKRSVTDFLNKVSNAKQAVINNAESIYAAMTDALNNPTKKRTVLNERKTDVSPLNIKDGDQSKKN